MDENRNLNSEKADIIGCIFYPSQNLIQVTDTKISILLAIDAMIVSLFALRNPNKCSTYPVTRMIFAIILSISPSQIYLLIKDYSIYVCEPAFVQKERYFYLTEWLVFLTVANLSIAVSFVFDDMGGA